MKITINPSLRLRLLLALKEGEVNSFTLPELCYDEEQIKGFEELISNQDDADNTDTKRQTGNTESPKKGSA